MEKDKGIQSANNKYLISSHLYFKVCIKTFIVFSFNSNKKGKDFFCPLLLS